MQAKDIASVVSAGVQSLVWGGVSLAAPLTQEFVSRVVNSGRETSPFGRSSTTTTSKDTRDVDKELEKLGTEEPPRP